MSEPNDHNDFSFVKKWTDDELIGTDRELFQPNKPTIKESNPNYQHRYIIKLYPKSKL